MIIPEEIKLGGHTVKIGTLEGKYGSVGWFDPYHNLIQLARMDTPGNESAVAGCFLRTILDAIRIKHNLEIDHTHLTVLSEALFQVLRENRLLFHLMCDGPDGPAL